MGHSCLNAGRYGAHLLLGQVVQHEEPLEVEGEPKPEEDDAVADDEEAVGGVPGEDVWGEHAHTGDRQREQRHGLVRGEVHRHDQLRYQEDDVEEAVRDGHETDPQASEVTRTPQTRRKKEIENGIIEISTSRGFRKVIICHVFGGKKILTIVNAQKDCRHLRRQDS